MVELTKEQIKEIESKYGFDTKGKVPISIVELEGENGEVEYRFVFKNKLSRNAFSKALPLFEKDVVTAMEIVVQDVCIKEHTSPEFFDPENYQLLLSLSPALGDLMQLKKSKLKTL